MYIVILLRLLRARFGETDARTFKAQLISGST